MRTNSQPKTKISFPNAWAVNSFLTKLKRFSGWEFHASTDDVHFRVKPKGFNDYILIGLNKSGNTIVADINAEKLGDKLDGIWTEIQDYARRYRC
jgi:hypothetical protein